MMMKSGVKKVAVIGMGLMGSGIAQVVATHGFDVIVNDVNESALKKGFERIRESLDRLVEGYKKSSGSRGLSPDQKENVFRAIKGSSGPADLLDADIIIEAAVENEDTKKNIISSLSELGYHNLMVSNTSSISITRLGSAYAHPEKFMGMHFMNPVPVQPGCELIRGLLTSSQTHARVTAFSRELAKEPILSEDKAGFGINRMFIPFLIEAVKVVEEGIMNCENADKTTICLGHKMGPITTLDYVGLDTALAIAEVLEKDLGPRYKAPDLLYKLVAAGYFGVKNGKGFYLWEGGRKIGVSPAVERYQRKSNGSPEV
jgi:3-hydroxybutyryl-CoA dehydrogenase